MRSILLMRGKYEWLKYLSSSYRFNGKVLSIIKNLTVHQDDTFDGYIGLEGSLESRAMPVTDPSETSNMVPLPVPIQLETPLNIGSPSVMIKSTRLSAFTSNRATEESGSPYSVPFWDLKVSYLIELARNCKANGTRLILFHSPRFLEDPTALAAWSKRLSALNLFQEGVEFLDLSARTREHLVGRLDLFKDSAHLNSRGAEVFSILLADELATRLAIVAEADSRVQKTAALR